ncbi:unnamed protein product [Moneuplotes crassus]|uniref:Uncharacterized protein n=1 Tax=Euplotes crassus TaxID=5936 RepID=A0AAD1UCA5_EUPCR|nr:unnamed protein product [Moneuplotes crassus]
MFFGQPKKIKKISKFAKQFKIKPYIPAYLKRNMHIAKDLPKNTRTIPRRRSLENPVTIEFSAFQSERKCKAPVSKPEKGLAGLKSLRKDNSKPILTPIMLLKPFPIKLK